MYTKVLWFCQRAHQLTYTHTKAQIHYTLLGIRLGWQERKMLLLQK